MQGVTTEWLNLSIGRHWWGSMEENGFDYWVIPELKVKGSKGITRGKIDKKDSKDITYYAITHLHI